jgi:hypothetical protein
MNLFHNPFHQEENKNQKVIEMAREEMNQFAEAAVLLDTLPHGVIVARLDEKKKIPGQKRGYRYGARFNKGKRYYGDTLLEVLQLLQKHHVELEPLHLIYINQETDT